VSRLAFPFAVTALGRSAHLPYGSDEHVRQMLELLIMTVPGERVMRPELGSPARQLVFGAEGGPAGVALGAALQSSVQQWLGDVLTLLDLTIDTTGEDGSLDIVVNYEVKATGTVTQTSVARSSP